MNQVNDYIGRKPNRMSSIIKRNKIIVVIGVVFVFIIPIVAVTTGSKNGLMGNSVFGNSDCNYVCEEGWSLDNNLCIQTDVNSSIENANLVGDVINKNGEMIPDGEVTLADFKVIRDAINHNVELDENQKKKYDLNRDGMVNENDVLSYSTSTLGEFQMKKYYYCPDDGEYESSVDDNVKKNILKKYTLKGNKCVLMTKTKLSKQPICEKKQSEEIANVGKYLQQTPVYEKVLVVDNKIMQDLYVDKDENYYISQDYFLTQTKSSNGLYISKIDKNGNVTKYLDGVKKCGHGTFSMTSKSNSIIVSCSEEYEYLKNGHIVYSVNKFNKTKTLMKDFYPGLTETLKIDEDNNQAIVRKDKRTFVRYKFDVQNMTIGEKIDSITIPDSDLPPLNGQGYSLYGDYLYIQSGEGRGTGSAKNNYSEGYVYVYSFTTKKLLKKNKTFYDADLFKEPEGIFVRGNYAYIGIGSTGRSDGTGGTKYATIYKIETKYLNGQEK